MLGAFWTDTPSGGAMDTKSTIPLARMAYCAAATIYSEASDVDSTSNLAIQTPLHELSIPIDVEFVAARPHQTPFNVFFAFIPNKLSHGLLIL